MTGMFDADDIMYWVFGSLGMAALLVWSLAASCEEADRRAVIRAKCTPVAHISGDVIPTYDGKNIGVAFTADKTCYRCPDGFEECF